MSKLAATVAFALVAALALHTTKQAPELGYVPWSPRGALALLAPGMAACAVAVASPRRDRCAALLALAGIASLMPQLSIPGTTPALAFTAGLALAWTTPALVAHLALVYPARAAGAATRVLTASGYLGAIGSLGLVAALSFDPVASGCGECAGNLLRVPGGAGLQGALGRPGMAATFGWAAICAAVILARVVRGTRRLHAPVLIGAIVLLAAFAAELALSLRRGFLDTGRADRVLWLAGQASLLTVALSVAARRLRTRHARTLLARDVVELSDPATRLTVADRLGALLGDPTLEVAYPVGDGPTFADVRGTPVDPCGPDVTVLRAPDGRPMAALRHRPGLLDDPAVVHAITSAAALALAHERLATEARGRLAQLQASRRRIVAAADAERRRVEHDLHDGAQQRLVSLAVALRAAAANGDDGGNLDAARAELGEALAELRTIARGLYPAVLTEMGLAAALEALAETAPLPLKLSALPEARLEPGVEAAAYFAVSELLLDPAAAHVTVTGRHGDGALRLTLTTDAPGCELTRIADRVGASGGSVRRRRANGTVELDMEIPCAS